MINEFSLKAIDCECLSRAEWVNLSLWPNWIVPTGWLAQTLAKCVKTLAIRWASIWRLLRSANIGLKSLQWDGEMYFFRLRLVQNLCTNFSGAMASSRPSVRPRVFLQAGDQMATRPLTGWATILYDHELTVFLVEIWILPPLSRYIRSELLLYENLTDYHPSFCSGMLHLKDLLFHAGESLALAGRQPLILVSTRMYLFDTVQRQHLLPDHGNVRPSIVP